MGINRAGSLGLEIPVINELRGDPKYLVRLGKLIYSSESAKQSLGMEVRAWSLPSANNRSLGYRIWCVCNAGNCGSAVHYGHK